jgi:hypothetical protein
MLYYNKSIMEISLFRSTSLRLKPLARLFIILLISIHFLAGCSPGPAPIQETNPAMEQATHSVLPDSPTQEASPQQATSPTQSDQVADENAICIPRGDSSSILEGPFDTYPFAIQKFLNEGGWVDDLDKALYAAEIASLPVPVGVADITGNGFEEVVVSIFDPGSVNMPPAGMLLIYTCDRQEFRLIYQEDSQPPDGAPVIRFLQDLNADGVSELVVSSASCGAHTCFERVQVIGWDGSQFINLLEGDTDDLPYPTIYLEPSTKEGIYNLLISGSGFGSVGAGPQRNIMRIWSFDQDTQRWRVDSTQYEPSVYRIHILHDAGAAAKDGDYQQALMLYNRAISDTTLDDWVDPALEKAWISAFARYQLVAIYSLLDRDSFASTILGEMEKAYPQDSPQHGYFQMAAAYLDSFMEEGAEAGCAAAIEFVTAHPELLDPLGPQIFGYGNPAYTLEDICP